MNTTIVNNIGLYNLIAICLHDLGKRPTQKVVAHVSQVKRFICVRRRILNHHERRILVGFLLTKVFVCINIVEQSYPSGRSNREVKESLNNIELGNSLAILLQILTNLLSCVLWLLARHLQKRKDNKGEITLEITTSFLQLHH